MTTNVLRLIVCLSVVLLFDSTRAYAQWPAEVSYYGDVYLDEQSEEAGSSFEVYVELLDTSDFSACSYLCYHHSYVSSVEVYGDGGGDSDEGSGMGPYDLEVAYSTVPDTFALGAYVTFTCTAAGELMASIIPIPTVNVIPFIHWYNLLTVDGDQAQYIVDSSSFNKICGVPNVFWRYSSPSTMTRTGAAVGFIPLGVFLCQPHSCSSGHNFSPFPPVSATTAGWGRCPVVN